MLLGELGKLHTVFGEQRLVGGYHRLAVAKRRLGDGCIVVAQTGISGSTKAGKYVTFGGQSGINGHITIGDGATIAGQAGVFADVPAGQTVSGYPARPHKEALRAQAGLFRLPQLAKRLRALERAVFGTQDDPER